MNRGFAGSGAALAAIVLAVAVFDSSVHGLRAQQDAPEKKQSGKGKPAARGKADAKAATDSKTKTDAKTGAKPLLVGKYGEWSAYVTQGGKDKTCYALSQPDERLPTTLKRDPAYVFISTRPAENVKNEVSIIMGFGMKDGVEASADIAGEAFELLGKGANAWVKNAAREPQFVDALRKGAKLTVKAPSLKGNVTTDRYSLSGLGQALDRVAKECQ